MHITLKRTFFFLAFAVVTGAIGFSNIMPMINRTMLGASMFCVVLVMFFAVAYSLRGEEATL